ncbi:9074_t:CDS:2, partial [Racocetra fulgida]
EFIDAAHDKVINEKLNEAVAENYQDARYEVINEVLNESLSLNEVEVENYQDDTRQSFHTWDDVENFLKDYGLEKGFSIRKKRIETQTENDTQILCKV